MHENMLHHMDRNIFVDLSKMELDEFIMSMATLLGNLYIYEIYTFAV